MEYYTRAIKADCKFAPPYCNIGKIHDDNDKAALAKDYYKKALQRDSYCVDSAENLAIIMCSEGNYEEAINLLLRTIYADPRRAQTYQNLIRLAEALEEEGLMTITVKALRIYLPRVAEEISKVK